MLENFRSPASSSPSSPIIRKAGNGGKSAQQMDFH
jgi:hypothetical protein